MIYLLAMVTGTAFITNSENGALTTFSRISCKRWSQTRKCKVPQHAAGARKKHGNQAIGVSRGGKTTKIHALVTENFQLIGVLLTGSHIHDSECATELLSKVKLDDKTVLDDKANSRTSHKFDRDLYKVRNVVERFFLRIKTRRRIATRYDKLAVCFLIFVILSALLIQL